MKAGNNGGHADMVKTEMEKGGKKTYILAYKKSYLHSILDVGV